MLHEDTQATLLLTGRFAPDGLKPLALGEYNAVASWLAGQGLRPAALLDGRTMPTGDEVPDAKRLRSLLGRGLQMAAAVERWERMGLWIVGRGEPRYPERLRRALKSQAPPLLCGAGDIGRLTRGGMAMVGSRDTPEEGLAFARRCAQRCVAENRQIVSGGAKGVDRESVAAALAAGGGAVAVISSNLVLEATAKQNKDAVRRGSLTLACPYEPDAPFTVWRAMGRNKHIYALADHAVVVRFTAGEGGTWAGAVERLDANKKGPAVVPVFVRERANAAGGLAELVGRGAIPLPDESVDEPGFIARLEGLAAPAQSAPRPEATA